MGWQGYLSLYILMRDEPTPELQKQIIDALCLMPERISVNHSQAGNGWSLSAHEFHYNHCYSACANIMEVYEELKKTGTLKEFEYYEYLCEEPDFEIEYRMEDD